MGIVSSFRRGTEIKKPRCDHCGIRWPQSRLGLCRRCERTLGVDDRSIFERDQARRERAQARWESLYHAAPVNSSRRTVAVNGVEYEIIWDGSMDGAAARGLPPANVRGRPDFHPHSGRPRSPHLPGV